MNVNLRNFQSLILTWKVITVYILTCTVGIAKSGYAPSRVLVQGCLCIAGRRNVIRFMERLRTFAGLREVGANVAVGAKSIGLRSFVIDPETGKAGFRVNREDDSILMGIREVGGGLVLNVDAIPVHLVETLGANPAVRNLRSPEALAVIQQYSTVDFRGLLGNIDGLLRPDARKRTKKVQPIVTEPVQHTEPKRMAPVDVWTRDFNQVMEAMRNSNSHTFRPMTQAQVARVIGKDLQTRLQREYADTLNAD